MRLPIGIGRIALAACLGLVAAGLAPIGSAMAADLAMPQPDQAMTDGWTGLYAGTGLSHSAFAGPVVSTDTSLDLFLGANKQVGQFVLGARGQISYTVDSLIGGLWAARADVRTGVLVTPQFLAYGTLGIGHALIVGGTSYYTFGVGAEFALTSKVSLYAEATHGIELGGPFTINGVSTGLNWHF